MEKIVKNNISTLEDRYIYRTSSDNKLHVQDIKIENEIDDKSWIVNKFNDKNLYKNKNDDFFELLDPIEFPEKNACSQCILTNDGILAFLVGTDAVIYDLLYEHEDISFTKMQQDSVTANNESLKKIDKSASLEYHYLLSFDNNGFIPLKISDKLFYIDCDSIEGYTKTNDGYFERTTVPDRIETIKIKEKSIYNIKVYNDQENNINSLEIKDGTIEVKDGLLSLKSKNGESVVVELW